MSVKYDPMKTYTWEPTDVFEITGEQFGGMLNILRGIVGTPEAAKVFAAEHAIKQFELVMKKAVEAGVIVEMPEPQVDSPNLDKSIN